jgi:hypothetical protein
MIKFGRKEFNNDGTARTHLGNLCQNRPSQKSRAVGPRYRHALLLRDVDLIQRLDLVVENKL